MEEFVKLISNLGFPIAAYVALFWKMIKQDDEYRKGLESVQISLDKNTEVMRELCERITVDE